jgi:hypothetical protein
MAYRNKTYVIFDGDSDIWAYAFMKGWKANERIDFDFYDAHEVNKLLDDSSERTVKGKLRERLNNTKQAIVLVGKKTKDLYRYVRWELETCLELNIPIVAANLNELRKIDLDLCPPIIQGTTTMHIPFRMKAIKFALDDFPANYESYKGRSLVDMFYPESVYERLDL